jgi:hypothetical protein
MDAPTKNIQKKIRLRKQWNNNQRIEPQNPKLFLIGLPYNISPVAQNNSYLLLSDQIEYFFWHGNVGWKATNVL